MKIENKMKLKKFMEVYENRLLIVGLLTILLYLVLMSITDNFIIRMVGYFVLFFLSSKLYNWLYFKLFGNFNK